MLISRSVRKAQKSRLRIKDLCAKRRRTFWISTDCAERFFYMFYVVIASALIPISQRFMGNNFGRNTCAVNLRNGLNPKLRATELRNYKLVNSSIVFENNLVWSLHRP